MLKTTKINNFVTKYIPHGGKKKKAKGSFLFKNAYSNIGIIARKHSGKTNLLFNILPYIIGTKTEVLFLVPTFYKDNAYNQMRELLDEADIKYRLFETYDEVLNYIENPEEEEEEEEHKPSEWDRIINLSKNSEVKEKENNKLKKQREKKLKLEKKYTIPEYVIISDDNGDYNRTKKLANFLKKNRHYKAKIFIISQDLTDIHPTAIKQLDYILLFKGISDDRLEHLLKKTGLKIDIDDFKKIYDFATEKKYNFLYVDLENTEFRKNMNEKISFT